MSFGLENASLDFIDDDDELGRDKSQFEFKDYGPGTQSQFDFNFSQSQLTQPHDLNDLNDLTPYGFSSREHRSSASTVS